MRSSKRVFALAVAASAAGAALAGCADVGGAMPARQTYTDSTFDGSEIGYAAQFGPMPVFARGGPLDNPGNAAAVVAAFNRNESRLSGMRFAAASAPPSAGYFAVIVSGPPVPGASYCSGRVDVPLAPGPQITGNFCLGSRLRSQAVLNPLPGDIASPQSAPALDRFATTLFSAGSRGRGRVFD